MNKDKDSLKLTRLLSWYNMIPNVIWSVLNLLPISVFCYREVDRRSLYAFIAVSIVPAFFPNRFYDKMQLARTIKTYKKLGVGLVNVLAQNGVVINRLVRKKFPRHKMIAKQQLSISRMVQQTYMFEKFHFIMFVFFVLITIYAIAAHQGWWAIVISICNVVYNVYPNLLQQYIRLRLRLHYKKPNAM